MPTLESPVQVAESIPPAPSAYPRLISAAIRVEAPCSQVFQGWRAFDEFPHFMRGSDAARGFDGSRMVWRVYFDGVWVPWDAEVIHEQKDDGVFWNNHGAGRPCGNSGSVCFVPESATSTRIQITCEFAPAPGVRQVEESLEELAARLQRGLVSFHSAIKRSGDRAAALTGDPRRSGWLALLPDERTAVEAFFNLKCPFSFCPE
jgi:uncharacterized membrane protein